MGLMIRIFRASIAEPGNPGQPGGGTSTLDRELEELLNTEQIEPGDHDPEKFPICPTCKEIYDTMKK